MKHNFLRSLSPHEGGPAERSRSRPFPVSRDHAILLRPTDHAFGAVPAAEERGWPPMYAPVGGPSITVQSIGMSSGPLIRHEVNNSKLNTAL